MSDIVALAAFQEPSHNAGRMWRTMAVLAFGYCLVLFLMAECACQGLVLGIAGAKEVKGLLMAYAAVL